MCGAHTCVGKPAADATEKPRTVVTNCYEKSLVERRVCGHRAKSLVGVTALSIKEHELAEATTPN